MAIIKFLIAMGGGKLKNEEIARCLNIAYAFGLICLPFVGLCWWLTPYVLPSGTFEERILLALMAVIASVTGNYMLKYALMALICKLEESAEPSPVFSNQIPPPGTDA